MMHAQRTTFRRLKDPRERGQARLAAIAVQDTRNGTASAMRYLKHGGMLKFDALHTIGEVYRTGSDAHFAAWECGFCGTVFADVVSAEACCDEIRTDPALWPGEGSER